MKTIEQGAQEHYVKTQIRIIRDDEKECLFDFKAGVKFSQRWIDVKEELPKEYEQVLVKVLLQKDNKEYEIVSLGDYSYFSHHWNIIHSLIKNGFHAQSWKVTHWRPIELK